MEEGQHEISIKKFNKVELLRLLWENQKSASFYGGRGPSFNVDGAKEAIDRGYIDYFCGRAIKCDLSKDVANSRLYDRDSDKTFKEIINKL